MRKQTLFFLTCFCFFCKIIVEKKGTKSQTNRYTGVFSFLNVFQYTVVISKNKPKTENIEFFDFFRFFFLFIVDVFSRVFLSTYRGDFAKKKKKLFPLYRGSFVKKNLGHRRKNWYTVKKREKKTVKKHVLILG